MHDYNNIIIIAQPYPLNLDWPACLIMLLQSPADHAVKPPLVG